MNIVLQIYDVTEAGIVTKVKIPCANFYMVSEWETQFNKETNDTKFWHGLFYF